MSFLYNPTTPDELTKYYLVWILLLMALHIIYDWLHPRTPDLTASRLTNKINEIFSASSAANSLLLCLILLNGFKTHPLFSSDAIQLPLILSGLVGFVVGLKGLIPTETSNR